MLDYVKVFFTGGVICVIAQILMDKTKLMPARILVIYVTVGTFLTGLGIYDYVVDFGGSGATVPLIGFGYALGKGVMEEVSKSGFIGVFTGGLTATSGALAAALLFGYLAAIIFNPKDTK
jgi:stage V sporulation protein AE